MSIRDRLKQMARGAALFTALPFILSFRLRSLVLGPDRALEGSSQTLGLIPGLPGRYLRRAFLSRVLEHCAPTATIEFGTLFSQCRARIDENVYVGPRCHLGLVHLERDVLLAAGVHIPSGQRTHAIADSGRAIRDQPIERVRVTIGEGSWVGAAAVVMADVGAHAVVGAGAVVTKPVPEFVLAAGVPARVVRSRRAPAASSPAGDLLERGQVDGTCRE